MLTAAVVAVNPTLVAPAAIVTEAGTVTELLLLDKFTVVALVAADVSVTVQASVPAPVSDPLLQETVLSVAGACPVPLRLMVVVPPVEALLLIVTDPLAAPAAVGSKLIVSVAVCFGFSVIGTPMPDSAKPVPAADTALIVSAAVPEEVSVTDFVAVVLSASVPKATLVELKLSAAVVAFSVRAKVFETPPDVAVSVADWFVPTAAAVAVKLALEAPAAMVTEAGTVTTLLLLAKVTVVALVAADVKVTVQASVPAPVSDPLLHVIPLSVAGACPVPLRLIIAVPLVALLPMVTEPLKLPAVAGSKPIVRVAVCPGFSVIGPLIPESLNPVPAIDTPLIVSAAVPDDVSVTVLLVAVFNASVPKATLVELSVIAGVDEDGLNSSVVVAEMPFDVAVSVTVCGELTADTVAVNGSLVSWVQTYMSDGTWTAALLLVSATMRMPDVLRLIVTVQVVVPAAVNALGLHDTPESCAVAPNEDSGKQANNKLSRPALRHRRRPT
ncbi:MAG: hypothetical protein WA476_00565 [Acidobacteriaceae bacterium]